VYASGTPTLTTPWITWAPPSIVYSSNWADPQEIEGFSPVAEAKAARLLRLTAEAIDRAICWLRKLRPRAPALPAFSVQPARACSLSGSWRAQGPP